MHRQWLSIPFATLEHAINEIAMAGGARGTWVSPESFPESRPPDHVDAIGGVGDNCATTHAPSGHGLRKIFRLGPRLSTVAARTMINRQRIRRAVLLDERDMNRAVRRDDDRGIENLAVMLREFHAIEWL